MPEQFSLAVRDALQERQIRRLGAAVSLLWERLPEQVREDIILQASLIQISGETTASKQLEDQIRQFLDERLVGKA